MYIKIKATPGAKKELFEKRSDDTFTVCVKEPAKNNRANKRISALIALHFGVSEEVVRLVSGHRSRNKVFSVEVEGKH